MMSPRSPAFRVMLLTSYEWLTCAMSKKRLILYWMLVDGLVSMTGCSSPLVMKRWLLSRVIDRCLRNFSTCQPPSGALLNGHGTSEIRIAWHKNSEYLLQEHGIQEIVASWNRLRQICHWRLNQRSKNILCMQLKLKPGEQIPARN